ncbi:hypothetical protein A3709_05015 [Halioglobus sp. HI00S01]|uniref:hypothetical protein n=1 Tax=Halioglobus sp. HI00S01 TaxID=1822214 RepID=UPI0007C2C693|nr:hypothetical protein [Halioglobus sp. HI00S01]KZX57123.1 hypothetical protein A3709_05015 [Halioglobus sp. HI00S01]
MPSNPNAPVIVAYAQHTWPEPDAERTPLNALESISRQVLANANCDVLADSVDAIATVRFIMDTDPNLAPLLPRNPGRVIAERVGLDNPQCFQTGIGGNTPQFLVNHFANRLAQGEFKAVLVNGAEFIHNFFSAMRSGADISSWMGEPCEAPTMVGPEDKDGLNSSEQAHGLYEPINTYPLFESALRHSNNGQSLSAELCASMAAVAADNPYAWRQEGLSADAIATPDKGNRYIGYPYTKAMNALLAVDMAAAIIMTTAGHAAELGIPESQCIYLCSGTDINEVWHVSERPDLKRAPAIGKAVNASLAAADMTLEDIDHFDLYSCFPCAVEIACNEIGLDPLDNRGVTVTGGLPFFGGPGNNYSLHAIAQMADQLGKTGGNGLVTANGLYLTKHSVGIYSSEPPTQPWQPIDAESLQAEVDESPRCSLAANPEGTATVEAYTVAYDKTGPQRGFIVATNPSGERILANVEANSSTLARMLEGDIIGKAGQVTATEAGNEFAL